MLNVRSATLLAIVALAAIGLPTSSIDAQKPTEPDPKQAVAIQKTQDILDEGLIEAKEFQKEMPLEKLLAALQMQLPKDLSLKLLIDKDAFGDKFAEVAATPVALPGTPKRATLRTALEVAIAKCNIKIDYRIGTGEVAVTTPERALYTAVYDIQDLWEKPFVLATLRSSTLGRNQNGDVPTKDAAWKAATITQAIIASVDQNVRPHAVNQISIKVLNGNRLILQTNAAQHALIADVLEGYHRFGDLAVVVDAKLYEVDDAFYRMLLNAKKTPLDEGAQFKLLEKQTLALVGKEIKVDAGQEAALLSKFHVITCLPNPDQVRKGEKERQVLVEGASFVAELQVSSDRRFVRAKITESAKEVQVIQKVKVPNPLLHGDRLPPAPPKTTDAEIPFVKDSTFAQIVEIPDGGTAFVPVFYRPPSAKAKNRWWVLAVTARIRIEEEEKLARADSLQNILTHVVADVLKNPRLKATRDFYGTPDDKRFALVNSAAWTWSEEGHPKVVGFELVSPERKGKRLLGIRVDTFQDAGEAEGQATLTVTLVNVGGIVNGSVIGGCTLRYTARWVKDGWVVELAKDVDQ